MQDEIRSLAAERFRVTLELFQAGLDMKRQSLRRRHPEASEEEIDAFLRAWLQSRPGAERGDCPGRAVDWAAKIS